jgi:hypothetical protein
MFSQLALHPDADTYLNIQAESDMLDYTFDLLSLFILMNWIRVLKFLRYFVVIFFTYKNDRIMPSTGPVVQSIMDTLKSAEVRIFITLVLYILVMFALSFHISFGANLADYARWPDSM